MRDARQLRQVTVAIKNPCRFRQRFPRHINSVRERRIAPGRSHPRDQSRRQIGDRGSIERPAPQPPGPLTTTKFPADPLGSNLGDPHLGLQAGQGSWTAAPLADGAGWARRSHLLQLQSIYPIRRTGRQRHGRGGRRCDRGHRRRHSRRKAAAAIWQNDPTFTSQGPAIVDLTSVSWIQKHLG